MDLLERYLQAIGQYLPQATRQDILAELRANLQAQFDDRAEALNRPLTDPETAAILREHGRPVVLAARYLPQQYLIGPAIFPYYLMTLRRATPFVLLIFFLAHASTVLFVHTLPDLIAGVAQSLAQLFPDLIAFLAWITIAFVIAEFVYTRNHSKPFCASWNPSRLPPIKPQFHGKSRASRIADLIFHCLFMLYVLEIPRHPFLILGPGVFLFSHFNVGLAPVWHLYYVAFLFLLFFQLVVKITAIFAPSGLWETPINFAFKVLGLLVTLWLAFTNVYFVATSPATDLQKLAAVNHWMNLSLRIVLAIVLLDLILAGWKLRPSFQAKRLVF
jgi:hypothetical protein